MDGAPGLEGYRSVGLEEDEQGVWTRICRKVGLPADKNREKSARGWAD